METQHCGLWKKLFVMSDYLRDATEELNKTEFCELFNELTFSQFRAFRIIKFMTDRNPEGVTLKAIAQKLNVSAAAASGMIDLLVQKGVLERNQSQSDRREVCIRLTKEMKEEIDKVGEFLNCKIEELTTEFSEKEKNLLDELLEKLYQKIIDKG
ncbi:MAG: MarR family transcriptional regulator [Victivallaceae bacterium]|nr:MarR family transcriptional regulator [Victivallaceae bacterium]MDD4180380.1 MarR family transcriptional regulator [Victivallaceae bacterium]